MNNVIFRKYQNGTIIVLFPYIIENLKGECLSFTDMDSYNNINYNKVIQSTVQANFNEYQSLHNKLETNGYVLKVIKRAATNRILNEKNKLILF